MLTNRARWNLAAEEVARFFDCRSAILEDLGTHSRNLGPELRIGRRGARRRSRRRRADRRARLRREAAHDDRLHQPAHGRIVHWFGDRNELYAVLLEKSFVYRFIKT